MSEHADLTKWSLCDSIGDNRNALDAADRYESMLSAAGYDGEMTNPVFLIDCASDMLRQKEGLYGFTHDRIQKWIAPRLEVLEKLAKEHKG